MNKPYRLMFVLLLITQGAFAQEENGGIHLTPPPKVQPAVPAPATLPDEAPEAIEESADVDPLMAEVKRLLAEDEEGIEAGNVATTTTSPPPSTETDAGPRPLSTVLLQGTMALLGTVALILLLLAAAKRWGKRSPLLAGHNLGRVMGRIALSPQASLHFVRIQDEVLVVGVTQQNVSLIQTLDAQAFEIDEAPTNVEEARGPIPADFLSQLQSSQATLAESSTAMDEELDSLKGDLQRLKQYFQDSARARE